MWYCRPISVLCILSKLIERHVHDALYEYLTRQKLLFTAQSGFRAAHSCETALLRMRDIWSTAMDKGELNSVILLDLRKAFDLINHGLLLQKLKIYKCNNNSMKWFESYITGRIQVTSFRGSTSNSANITVGIPQGSILGPLFFILYMNDLPLHVTTNIDMYADDSTVHKSWKTIQDIEQNLNSDMKAISDWCSENKMVINTTKTKSMLITTKQRRSHLIETLTIKVNDQVLEQTDHEKLLGVVVDENLDWKHHIKFGAL